MKRRSFLRGLALGSAVALSGFKLASIPDMRITDRSRQNIIMGESSEFSAGDTITGVLPASQLP